MILPTKKVKRYNLEISLDLTGASKKVKSTLDRILCFSGLDERSPSLGETVTWKGQWRMILAEQDRPEPVSALMTRHIHDNGFAPLLTSLVPNEGPFRIEGTFSIIDEGKGSLVVEKNRSGKVEFITGPSRENE